MTPQIPFREFITSDRFAGRAFADDSWKPMKVILIGAVGEELHWLLHTDVSGGQIWGPSARI